MKTNLIMNKYYELRRNEIVKTNVIKIGECRSSKIAGVKNHVIVRNGLKVGLAFKKCLAMIALGEKIGGQFVNGFYTAGAIELKTGCPG